MIFGLVLCLALARWAGPGHAQSERFNWAPLPPLPADVPASVIGTHNGALIGLDTTRSTLHALASLDGSWEPAGSLPELSDVVTSVSLPTGIVCIGQAPDGGASYAVCVLTYAAGTIAAVALPELPASVVPDAVTGLGQSLYVIGRAGPSSAAFLHLDLAAEAPGWKELAPWPGPVRDGAIAAAQGGTVIVGGGQSPDGNPLLDAYGYTPGTGWRALAAPPAPIVGVPATSLGAAHIIVFGHGGEAPQDAVLAYHLITNTWAEIGRLPEAVEGPAVPWEGRIVMAGSQGDGGEDVPSGLWAATPIPTAHRAFTGLDYGVMLVYFAALVAMGFYFSRREKTSEDFFLGGRRVPGWAAGVSIFGTLLSAITFLSVPATAFATDWLYMWGSLGVLLIAPLIAYVYLPFFRRLPITTAYEYLEMRFNPGVRLFGSLAFVLFQLGRAGVVLYLPAIALSTATGIDVTLAIVFMGVLCTLYTVLGGIEAVIWTDVLQVFVLLGGALLALVLIGVHVDGGLPAVFQTGWDDGKFRMWNNQWAVTTNALWVVIVGRVLEMLIPYTTDQTVVQRYLTTASEQQARKAIWIGAILSAPSAFIFFGVGTALYVFYKVHPAELDPTLQNDAVFPLFIVQHIPPGLTGLIIAAVFAAAMSSLDSSLNSVSAVLVTDFYKRGRRGRSEAGALAGARWLTVVLGVFGTGMALVMTRFEIPSLWEHYMKIVGLFGGGLAGIFALGIFTTRTTGAGALLGVIAGAATLAYVQFQTPISFLLYSAIGIIVSFTVGYATSFFVGENRRSLAGLTWTTRHAESDAPR